MVGGLICLQLSFHFGGCALHILLLLSQYIFAESLSTGPWPKPFMFWGIKSVIFTHRDFRSFLFTACVYISHQIYLFSSVQDELYRGVKLLAPPQSRLSQRLHTYM